ncbi:MAG: hypothetical protein Q9220_007302 [cf. Caloplaca sp. 1 TL-2023]
MRFFALPVLVALSSLSPVHGSVTLIQSVKNGCIAYVDVNNVLKKLCKGSTGQIDGGISVNIDACVDPSTGKSSCGLHINDVSLSPKVYWGVDDCLYKDLATRKPS